MASIFRRTFPRCASSLLVVASACFPVASQAAECEKSQFEAVVADASNALRDLTAQNKPLFQEKLRGLKDKRGWTYDEFVKEAAPIVTDDKVTALDQTSAELLQKINRMGEAGVTDTAANCALLGDLKSTMTSLAATQTEKWTYLFGKLDAEAGR
jgi:hypothetical protein